MDLWLEDFRFLKTYKKKLKFGLFEISKFLKTKNLSF